MSKEDIKQHPPKIVVIKPVLIRPYVRTQPSLVDQNPQNAKLNWRLIFLEIVKRINSHIT